MCIVRKVGELREHAQMKASLMKIQRITKQLKKMGFLFPELHVSNV
jgi:hypothetical protein